LYNPASRARPEGLRRALTHLRQWKADDTIVLFVRAAGTPNATVNVTHLAEAASLNADMRTLVLVGSSSTRLIERDGLTPWAYTPRSEAELP
ncbi:MAG: precorrin-3B C(17)-methyltransferase, partial [Hyphomicrobium sp.]|nr:precorrin-3B C(17)-methyltransferase [Hyphomicrobium sp.]